MSNTITHHAGGRKMDIGIELEKNADLSKVSDQVRKQITEFQFPLGFHAETLGENVARSESQNRLLWASLAALVGVFLVLLADFQRWIPAALVMGTLPFALLGGGVATLFSGGVVSLGTLVGLITVVGIAARNSILLLSNYRRIAARGGGLSNEDIVAGAGERLSPILMTALSTGLALIPIVVSGSRAGHEIEHPLAVVVLGGILTATLMTLVALPLSVALMVRFRGAAWLLSADEETASQQQAQQVD
jgi:multidrug efflux pump subunit AcrB